MRTKEQKDADEFDCDLHRLIVRANRKAEEAVPVERAIWSAAGSALRTARFHVREMMHKDDIAQT